jgi:hypothetical protein
MLRIDWEKFGASIRAMTVAEASRYSAVEKKLGISHARMINAAQGKPVGVEIFLTLCHWLQTDPMYYCREAATLTPDSPPS